MLSPGYVVGRALLLLMGYKRGVAAFLVLSLLGLVLVFAGLELRANYRAEGVIGSKEWNDYQVRLRDHLDASPDEEEERKREVYQRRLEAGAARGVFADEEEHRRARVLKLHQTIHHSREQTELSETLRRARQDDQTL